MSEGQIIDAVLKAGPGAALAGLMFYFYRQDRNEDRRRLDRYAEQFRMIVENNTAALTRIIVLLENNEVTR